MILKYVLYNMIRSVHKSIRIICYCRRGYCIAPYRLLSSPIAHIMIRNRYARYGNERVTGSGWVGWSDQLVLRIKFSIPLNFFLQIMSPNSIKLKISLNLHQNIETPTTKIVNLMFIGILSWFRERQWLLSSLYSQRNPERGNEYWFISLTFCCLLILWQSIVCFPSLLKRLDRFLQFDRYKYFLMFGWKNTSIYVKHIILKLWITGWCQATMVFYQSAVSSHWLKWHWNYQSSYLL